MRFEEVPCGYIAHSKTDCGNRVTPEKCQQIIVPSAACERTAVTRVCVKNFKHHTGVVIKAPGNGGVHNHIADAHVFEHNPQFLQVRGRGCALEFTDELDRFLLVFNQVDKLLLEIFYFCTLVEQSRYARCILLGEAD